MAGRDREKLTGQGTRCEWVVGVPRKKLGYTGGAKPLFVMLAVAGVRKICLQVDTVERLSVAIADARPKRG